MPHGNSKELGDFIMNEKGRNILPMIGFILIVSLLLGGFALAKGVGNNLKSNSSVKKGILKNNSLGRYTIDDRGEVSTDGLDKIKINAVSSEINIQRHNIEKVEAHFYGNMTALFKEAIPRLEVVKEGDTAVVRVKYPENISGSISGNTKLDVWIPQDWDEDLDIGSTSGKITAPVLTGSKIRIETISGTIETDSIQGNDVRMSSASGDINAGDVTATGLFEKSTISGRFRVDTLKCDEAKLESTSGETFAELVSSDKVTASSISGRIQLTLDQGSAKLETTSGGIYAQFRDRFESFKANSVSGEIKLEVPDNSEFKIEINTISGSIDCRDFEMKLSSSKKNELKAEVGNGDSKIDIDTTSGSVEVAKR